MPFPLSNAQRRELDKRRSGDPYLWLATFTHGDLAEPFRVVSNSESVSSQGLTFNKGYFEVELPHDLNELPQGRITVPVIDRQLSNILLAINAPPRVKLQAVLSSEPDTVVEEWDFYFLREISGDAQTVSGTLKIWDQTTELWPARTGTQPRYPGLWW